MTKEETILCWKALAAFLFLVAAMCMSIFTSCSQEDGMFERESVETLPAVISADKTLYADTEYLLGKPVFVTNGATLTIQPGALLKALPAVGYGKAALVITKGCRIMAEGTEENPIVMTASVKQAGSWDGLTLLGKAPVSYQGATLYGDDAGTDISYGGTEENDNSGILRYVRVEYAGAGGGAFTFDATGRGTVIDHCQSYRSAYNGFVFNGGTANARYLIATGAEENGLCFNEGYTGKLQYVKATAPTPRSVWSVVSCNGMERTENLMPYTHPVIANLSTAHSTKVHGQCYPLTVSAYSLLTLVNSDTNETGVTDEVTVRFYRGELRGMPGTDYMQVNTVGPEHDVKPDDYQWDVFFERTGYCGSVPPDTGKDGDWTMKEWIKK